MGQVDLVTNAREADSSVNTELPAGDSNQRGVVALAIMLAIAAFILRYSLSHAPYGSHVDEPIVANLTHRALQEGKLSANWDRFTDAWWSKPTYQFFAIHAGASGHDDCVSQTKWVAKNDPRAYSIRKNNIPASSGP